MKYLILGGVFVVIVAVMLIDSYINDKNLEDEGDE